MARRLLDERSVSGGCSGASDEIGENRSYDTRLVVGCLKAESGQGAIIANEPNMILEGVKDTELFRAKMPSAAHRL